MENSRPKLLEPEVIEAILLDRSNRLQELIDVGRFDDAVSIGEEFDECRFPCPIRPKDAEEFTRVNFNVQWVERNEFAVSLSHVNCTYEGLCIIAHNLTNQL